VGFNMIHYHGLPITPETAALVICRACQDKITRTLEDAVARFDATALPPPDRDEGGTR